MQTNIIWTGKLYHSMENCIWTKAADGNEIDSTIVGHHESQIFKVGYQIKTNKNWETIFLTLQTQLDNASEIVTLENKGGMWLFNYEASEEFENCIDIDISLTPFTNTLPVNRLQLKDNERQIIDVIYFDILEKKIRPIKQVYTRIAWDHFNYENYDKSFKADIIIDEQGLVVDYPGLFAMTAKQESRLISF